MLASALVDFYFIGSKTAFLIRERPIDQLLKLLDPKRLELKNLRPRNQRAVDIKKRIVSGRADQPKIPSLDVRKEDVLLRLVEVMNLVDKEDRFSFRIPKTIRRSRQDATHFGDVA